MLEFGRESLNNVEEVENKYLLAFGEQKISDREFNQFI